MTSLISLPSSSSSTKYKRLDHAEVSSPFPIKFCTSTRTHTLSLLGISFKTQALYVTVFVSRYLDIFFTWVSLYNFIMKLFFISSSVYILYLMKVRFRYVTILLLLLANGSTSIHTHPAVSVQQMTRPSIPSVSSTSSAPLSSSGSYSTTPTPSQKYPGPSPSSSKPLPSSRSSSSSSAQAKQKQSRPTTSLRWAHTVDCTSLTGYTGASLSTRVVLCAYTLGIYDADMYLWGKRRYFAEELVDPISITAGLVQTGLYLDFFYVYFTKYVARAKYSPIPIALTLRTHPRTGVSRARSSSCQRDGCPPTAATCFTRTALVSSRARRESRLELYPVRIVILHMHACTTNPRKYQYTGIRSAMRVYSATKAQGISPHSYNTPLE